MKVIWQSSRCHLAGIWLSSGSHLAVIWQSSGSHLAVICQSSVSHLSVIWLSSGSILAVFLDFPGSFGLPFYFHVKIDTVELHRMGNFSYRFESVFSFALLSANLNEFVNEPMKKNCPTTQLGP